MNRCRHCRQEVLSLPHYCTTANRKFDEDDLDAFLLSAAIGAMTDSTFIGAMLGGDVVGAVVGGLLNGGSILDDE